MSETHGYPQYAKPHINWHHIDGPLLCCRDGSLHWLTTWECIKLWLRFTSIEKLDEIYRVL